MRQSRSQENDIAKAIGGRRTPGSGNQWHSKADVKSEHWLVEAKTTTQGSYSLKEQTFTMLRLQAIKEGKLPVLNVFFEREQLAIIPYELWLELLAKGGDEDDSES